jgi:hypothetical protein
MVRDKARFAKTNGWGYSAFDSSGRPIRDHSIMSTASCAGCHRLVPERGFVFSKPWDIDTSSGEIGESARKNTRLLPELDFKTLEISKLPKRLRKELPKSQRSVRLADAAISGRFSRPALDSARPLLTREAIRSGQPALLRTNDGMLVFATWVEKLNAACGADGRVGNLMKSISQAQATKAFEQPLTYCVHDLPDTPVLGLEKKPPLTQTIQNEMNGFRLSDFSGFSEKWKLVTIRYRKDSNEMRLTYANTVAFESLLNKAVDYPDGSIFAKIGIATTKDQALAGSAVPSEARRFQFMVRDRKRFLSTDGWGYAIFEPSGKRMGDDPSSISAACAACHRIVPQRGFVFSQPWSIELELDGGEHLKQETPSDFSGIQFETINVADLSTEIRANLPGDTVDVQALHHAMTRSFFIGTLDEVRPLLTRQAIRTGQPSLFWTDDRSAYAITWVERPDVSCGSDGKKGYRIRSVSAQVLNKIPFLLKKDYCWDE